MPEEDGSVPTVPEEDGSVPTVPEEDGSVPTVPEGDGSVPTVPEEDGGVPTVPKEDGSIPTVSEEGGDVSTVPEGDDGGLSDVGEENTALGDIALGDNTENGLLSQESVQQEGLVVTENGTIFINPDGTIFTGEKYIEGKGWAYFDPNNGGLMVNGWFELDWRTVYYDNGYMAHGETLASDGNYYYFDDTNGNIYTGEKMVGSYWSYYEPTTGRRVEGLYTLPDGRRVCYINGRMVYGTNRVWGRQYEFDTVTGAVLTGEGYDPENGWYYIDTETKDYVIGFKTIDWRTVYYNNGYMAYGETLASDGNYYYFDDVTGNMRVGEIAVGPHWSYFAPGTGRRVEGLYTLPDGRRVCYINGRMVYGTNRVWGRQYEFDTVTGAVLTGEGYDPENGWYYIDTETKDYVIGFKTIDWRTVYYNNGYMAYGETLASDGNYYYFDDVTGNMRVGEIAVGPHWSYFSPETGRRVEGFYTLPDGRRVCYVNGRMVYGKQVVYGDVYYFDPVDGHLLEQITGIDVSSNNGVIDWAKVKADGIDFVIIRAMHWSNASNSYVMDTMFVQNVYGAKSAGLLVGAYWFSEAFNGTEAAQEVQFIANSAEWKNLKQAGVVLDMPFYIDYEDYNWLNQHTTYESRTEAVRTGMDCAEQMLGTQSGFYTSDNYAQSWFNGQQLINEGYNAWIARWSSTAPQTSGYVMWQYSNSGTVNGINGRVDLNYSYESYTFHPVTNYTGNYTTITVYDENSKGDVTKNITEIVKQIVANEVGSGLGLTGMDRTELYKAQAVAAHSYLVSVLNAGGKPSVGLKDYSSFAGLSDAVEAVKNQMLIYNGSVINAVYTASSGSHTNSAANMGWTAQPYLTSVESKYDSQMSGAAKYYHRTSTIPLEDYYKNGKLQDGMRSNIIKMVGQQQYNAYASDPSKWISEIHTDAHGNIDYAIVCGVRVSGGKFYDNCWGLYGPNIDSWTQYDPNSKCWVFVSNGNGHGVGMSQYGAAGYIAKEGWNYKQILEHYYNGAKVVG